jgi:hypothetical protein
VALAIAAVMALWRWYVVAVIATLMPMPITKRRDAAACDYGGQRNEYADLSDAIQCCLHTILHSGMIAPCANNGCC